ncbi:MAG: SGNH/GDSL hydrolase family protein [Planctomycetota bacterium]
MRSVFVVGDSISIQYGPFLEPMLAGRIAYARKGSEDAELAKALRNLDTPMGANGGDSSMVLSYLLTRCSEPTFKPDLLLLNCGLHDIKRALPAKPLQIPPESYAANLRAIVALLRSRGTALAWVRTTAVVDAIHNARSREFHRHAADVVEYNRIADGIMEEAGACVIDLYGFTEGLGGDERFLDHVHFTEAVRRLQAAYIAGHLLGWQG